MLSMKIIGAFYPHLAILACIILGTGSCGRSVQLEIPAHESASGGSFISNHGITATLPADPELFGQVRKLAACLNSESSQARESARNSLIGIGIPAVPYLCDMLSTCKDAEVIAHIKFILAVIPIYGRARFSEELLNAYPDIYIDLSVSDEPGRLKILVKILEIDEESEVKFVIDDFVYVIAEILRDGGGGLSVRQKKDICAFCTGYGLGDSGGDGLYGMSGYFTLEGAAPHLAKLLYDGDSDVRVAALNALIPLDCWVLEGHIDALLDDPDPDIRRTALSALRTVQLDDAEERVESMLRDSDCNVRLSALSVLVDITETGIDKDVFLSFKDDPVAMRLEALEVIRKSSSAAYWKGVEIMFADEDGGVRSCAIRAISESKDRLLAEEYIAKALKDSDYRVRKAGIDTASDLGIKEATGDIIGLFTDNSLQIRISAIRALRNFSAMDTPWGVRSLLPEGATGLLDDVEPAVRSEAIMMFADYHILGAVGKIRQLLNDGDSRVRSSAVNALVILNIAEAAVDIRKLLKDQYPEVRKNAICAAIAFNDSGAADEITPLLLDEDEGIRLSAVMAIEKFAVRGAIPALRSLLRDGSVNLRREALCVLDNLHAVEAVGDITPLLIDTSDVIRILAIEVLHKFKSAQAVEKIGPLLYSDVNVVVRLKAFNFLMEFDVQNRHVYIEKALADTYLPLSGKAEEAFNGIPTNEQMKILKRLFDSGRPECRIISARKYGGIGNEEAIANLRGLLKDSNGDVCAAALNALIRINSLDQLAGTGGLLENANAASGFGMLNAIEKLTTQNLLPELFALLQNPDPFVRVKTLGFISDLDAPEAVPEVRKLLAASEASVRLRATEVLIKMRPDGLEDDLKNILADADSMVRKTAVTALGDIGAVGAIKDISGLLKDRNPIVRRAALSSLGALGAGNASDSIKALLTDDDDLTRGWACVVLIEFGTLDAPPGNAVDDMEFLYGILEYEGDKNKARVSTALKRLTKLRDE